jgi:hypothetical protein
MALKINSGSINQHQSSSEHGADAKMPFRKDWCIGLMAIVKCRAEACLRAISHFFTDTAWEPSGKGVGSILLHYFAMDKTLCKGTARLLPPSIAMQTRQPA